MKGVELLEYWIVVVTKMETYIDGETRCCGGLFVICQLVNSFMWAFK
jgi:hypothetical protein